MAETDTEDAPQLTPEARTAMEAYLRRMVGQWLKYIGIANLVALVGMVGYVYFGLPTIAMERLTPVLSGRLANLTSQLESELAQGFIRAGSVGARYGQLDSLAVSLGDSLAQVALDLEDVRSADLSQVAAVVRAAAGSSTTVDLLARLDALEQALRPSPGGAAETVLRINNPFMTGPDAAQCPAGTLVSGIVASLGVGGRYAIDGISEITVACSSILPSGAQ
jgi:hypothetical protein